MTPHVIAEVKFPFREDVGWLICTCGEEMPSDEFAEHRKAHGLTSSNTLRNLGEPTVWRLGHKR